MLLVNRTTGEVLFNTSATTPEVLAEARHATSRFTAPSWSYFQEPVGYGSRVTRSLSPVEQLNITNNDSDYLWYTTVVSPPLAAGEHGGVI